MERGDEDLRLPSHKKEAELRGCMFLLRIQFVQLFLCSAPTDPDHTSAAAQSPIEAAYHHMAWLEKPNTTAELYSLSSDQASAV